MKESFKSLWVKLEVGARRGANPMIKGRGNLDPGILGEATIARIRIRDSSM